jgi:hypothetical protein
MDESLTFAKIFSRRGAESAEKCPGTGLEISALQSVRLAHFREDFPISVTICVNLWPIPVSVAAGRAASSAPLRETFIWEAFGCGCAALGQSVANSGFGCGWACKANAENLKSEFR